jgi:hypothetical protein
MKKIILTAFAATSLLLYSTPSFAISLSVGVPVAASIKNDAGSEIADGASGYFLGVQLPFGLGLGMDSHKTKIKDSTYKVATSMYNLYYQLPVPVVSLILGLGTGNSNFDCADAYEGEGDSVVSCDAAYDKGAATQWYTSIGIPLIPLFDIHLSYRSITSKNIKPKGGSTKQDVSGTITGIGLAFNF